MYINVSVLSEKIFNPCYLKIIRHVMPVLKIT